MRLRFSVPIFLIAILTVAVCGQALIQHDLRANLWPRFLATLWAMLSTADSKFSKN